MKTVKFLLAAIFIASTIASMANADNFREKPRKAVNITFNNAIKKPELVKTMYLKIDPAFLNSPQPLYLVEVEHNGALFRILGSRACWLRFFRLRWVFPSDSPDAVRNIH